MKHGLPGIRTIVGDDPVAAVEQALALRHLARQVQKRDRDLPILRPEFAKPAQVTPRNNQDMCRGLRLDVAERDRVLVLGDEFGPERAVRDPAEDTVVSLAHPVLPSTRRRATLASIRPRALRWQVCPMPELPEVETVRRSLEAPLRGRRVTGLRLADFPGVIGHESREQVAARLIGRRFTGARRRAKYLLLDLDDGTALMVHLRMTGHLEIVPAAAPRLRFEHLAIALDDGCDLRFADQRKFGRVLHLQAADLRRLERRFGPEPLGSRFTADWLAGALAKRPGRLKSVLLDQEVVAGLGNIYADEALFRARLHPERPANGLSPHDVRSLHRAIRAVLREGVDRRGTSFSSYRDATGAKGENQFNLRVYGQGGHGPCPRCGWPLGRLVVGGRGTSFCPRCQRMPGDSRRMRMPGNEAARPASRTPERRADG